MTTFSDAVFEATQGLLSAQQQLTRALLNGQAGQTQTAVDEEPPDRGDEQGTDPFALDAGSEVDDEAGEVDGQTPGHDAAPAPAAQSGGLPDRRRRPRQATAGRMSSGAAI